MAGITGQVGQADRTKIPRCRDVCWHRPIAALVLLEFRWLRNWISWEITLNPNADPHPDNDFARREIRHRENTKWKYGLTRATRAIHLPSLAHKQTSNRHHTHGQRLVDWSVSRISREIAIRHFGIFSVSFCHHLGLSKLLGLLHLLRFFHTHCPRGNKSQGKRGNCASCVIWFFWWLGNQFSYAGDCGPCEPWAVFPARKSLGHG